MLWAAAVLAASIGGAIRKLGRLVAIKVPLPNKLESDDDIRLSAKQGPRPRCTIRTFARSMKSTGPMGGPYIVMCYVAGKSLADQIAEHKTPLPVSQAILIVAQLATALPAVHGKGIIHRDLKPANVMLDRDRNDVVIMDFRLARRVAGTAESSITESGMVMGTPAYMSPVAGPRRREESRPRFRRVQSRRRVL